MIFDLGQVINGTPILEIEGSSGTAIDILCAPFLVNDKFTHQVLEQTGLMGMIGKAERGPVAIEAIKEFESTYLMAVGGAAYLVSQAIKKSEVKAFPELGMEAIYEFDVVDMPVTVAVDSKGESVHQTGPKIWQQKIEEEAIEIK